MVLFSWSWLFLLWWKLWLFHIVSMVVACRVIKWFFFLGLCFFEVALVLFVLVQNSKLELAIWQLRLVFIVCLDLTCFSSGTFNGMRKTLFAPLNVYIGLDNKLCVGSVFVIERNNLSTVICMTYCTLFWLCRDFLNMDSGLLVHIFLPVD
jgi:hypothetical protein